MRNNIHVHKGLVTRVPTKAVDKKGLIGLFHGGLRHIVTEGNGQWSHNCVVDSAMGSQSSYLGITSSLIVPMFSLFVLFTNLRNIKL